MAAALEMAKHHHATEMPYVKAVGCGVNSEVCRGHTLFKLFVCAGHDRVDHATPGKFFNKIHFISVLSYYHMKIPPAPCRPASAATEIASVVVGYVLRHHSPYRLECGGVYTLHVVRHSVPARIKS